LWPSRVIATESEIPGVESRRVAAVRPKVMRQLAGIARRSSCLLPNLPYCLVRNSLAVAMEKPWNHSP
jgi:hypothetical protein